MFKSPTATVVEFTIVVLPRTVRLPPIIASPVDSNVVNLPVDGVVLPIGVLSNAKSDTLPATFKLPPIPTPPDTTNAPVFVLVDSVRFVIIT